MSNLKYIVISLLFLAFLPSLTNHSYSESGINVDTSQLIYESTSRIFVHGQVYDKVEFYKPVTITMTNETGSIIYEVPVPLDGDSFHTLLTGVYGTFDTGLYAIKVSHPSIPEKSRILVGIADDVDDFPRLDVLVPLKQLEIVENPSLVICGKDHVLVENNHRNSVACVSERTSIALEKRDWGTHIDSQ